MIKALAVSERHAWLTSRSQRLFNQCRLLTAGIKVPSWGFAGLDLKARRLLALHLLPRPGKRLFHRMCAHGAHGQERCPDAGVLVR